MQGIRIVLLGLVAAVGYGVVHDQVTARISLEYFTIGHPALLPTESPTLLALAWGVVATWWVGLPLGVMPSAAARLGRRPKLVAAQLQRPLAVLLLCMAAGAVVAGVIGGILAASGNVWLVSPMYEAVPVPGHTRFLIALWMHTASYVVGIGGALILAGWTWRHRGRVAARAV